MSADAFHEQDSTPRPCRIIGGTDMPILHTTTTRTPIGVHCGAMHGNPRQSPEDRASDRAECKFHRRLEDIFFAVSQMTRENFAKLSQEICKFCIIVCTAPLHKFHAPKKKIVTAPRRGWICGDVNSWLTASTWSPQAWLTFCLICYFTRSIMRLCCVVARNPSTPAYPPEPS